MHSPTSKEPTCPVVNAPKASKSKSRSGIFRVLISAALLLVVYNMADIDGVIKTLSNVSIFGALAVMIGYALGQLLSAVKWRIFVTEAGINRPQYQVTRAYFLGMFANSFGLGTIGGDVARSLLLTPAPGQRAAALATVVADRLHGLATLILLGAVGVLFAQPAVMGNYAETLALATLFFLCLCWWLGPKLLVAVFAKSPRYSAAAVKAANAFPRRGRPIIVATGLSIAFHSLHVCLHLLVAHQLGAEISLLYLFATVPFVNVASALPLSVNGLGIREAMYVLLFVPYGLSEETAVAFGAVWIVSVTVVSALGGLFFASGVRQLFGANQTPEQGSNTELAVEENTSTITHNAA